MSPISSLTFIEILKYLPERDIDVPVDSPGVVHDASYTVTLSVTPQDDLMTDIDVTEYAFQVIDDTANSSSIVDADGNTLVTQGLSGIIRATADINIDTAAPKTQNYLYLHFPPSQ